MDCLTFKVGKKEYKSKPFDFAAMCYINEKQNDEKIKGVLMMCDDAVKYLFDGTDGENAIKDIAPGAYAQLCIDVWNMYIRELSRKNG